MPARWIEVAVETDAEVADAVAELFARFGYQQEPPSFNPVAQDPDGETRPSIRRLRFSSRPICRSTSRSMPQSNDSDMGFGT
jgi:hypothetical protein